MCAYFIDSFVANPPIYIPMVGPSLRLGDLGRGKGFTPLIKWSYYKVSKRVITNWVDIYTCVMILPVNYSSNGWCNLCNPLWSGFPTNWSNYIHAWWCNTTRKLLVQWCNLATLSSDDLAWIWLYLTKLLN